MNSHLRQHNDRVAGEYLAKIDEIKKFLVLPNNEIAKLEKVKEKTDE